MRVCNTCGERSPEDCRCKYDTDREAASPARPASEAVHIRPWAYAYKYRDLSGDVWVVDNSGPWNGQKPKATMPLYWGDDVEAALCVAQAVNDALRRDLAAASARLGECEADAARFRTLQADIDKQPHESRFSLYEYGAKVFALRQCLDFELARAKDIAASQADMAGQAEGKT